MSLAAKLQTEIDLVQRALKKVGQNVDAVVSEKEVQWHYLHGSAPVRIRLYQQPETTTWYIEVASTFMPLPPDGRRPEFYENLLRLNLKYPAVAFAITDTDALLKSDREIRGLDVRELSMMIHRISLISDHYDDQLRQKYLSETA